MIRKPLALACAVAAAPAIAETPQVATDIAPIHSLVAMVMGDLGTPDLIVTPGASPHTYALRPSQARALQNADLVVGVPRRLQRVLDNRNRSSLFKFQQRTAKDEEIISVVILYGFC